MAKKCSPFHTCIQACLMLVSIPTYNGLMESGMSTVGLLRVFLATFLTSIDWAAYLMQNG